MDYDQINKKIICFSSWQREGCTYIFIYGERKNNIFSILTPAQTANFNTIFADLKG